MIGWTKFVRFNTILDKYMSDYGEGDNMASQITAAINKIIFKYYNTGDIFDTTYNLLGMFEDLSDYANWLYINAKITELDEIKIIKTEEEYEELLYKIASKYLTDGFLSQYKDKPAVDSIYKMKGPFKYVYHKQKV